MTLLSSPTASAQRFLLAIFIAIVAAANCLAEPGWTVAPPNAVTLTSSPGIIVDEMSGVTYLGPSPSPGKHRFLTALEDVGNLGVVDVEFSLDGNILSATATETKAISSLLDYEGIVSRGNNLVFLSEESTPGIREFDLASGNEVASVAIPTAFNNIRSNRGFESLASSADGNTLWTANEEALSIDGAASTTSAITTVRIQQFDTSGETVTAGAQYAYEVEPVHTAGFELRRGLSELVSLPDGTLLGLERSFAFGAAPSFVSAIYEIDFAGATDISDAAFDAGLSSASYTPVGKELLWSGQAGSVLGENLEGLSLGPRLPNGNWTLLGVVDNGDPISGNTVVSFEIENLGDPIPFDPDTGDFDQDEDIDGADFLAWQRGFGVTTLASVADGDGNHSGTVTDADLAIWSSQYSTPTAYALHAIPEPSSFALCCLIGVYSIATTRRRWCAA